MKKMKLIVILLITTFAVVFCQPDKEFTKPIKVVSIIYSDGTIQTTAYTGTGGTTVNWTNILNKPSVFAPSAHGHKWSEITEKPDTIGLQEAIESLGYLPIPSRTTTEINAIILPVDKSGIVHDITLDAYKIWEKTIWKILITGN